jgi:NADPH-dependent glutamate synthase beta subunit-like oxidoreductase
MSQPGDLPSWLDPDAGSHFGFTAPAATVAGSLPGYARAESMTALQRLAVVQASGRAECGGAGEPIAQAWRDFLRGHGPSTLVVEATGFDERAQGSATVLRNAPWLLAEGLLIALGLRDSQTIVLRLPASLTGLEGPFLNAVDAIRALAQVADPSRAIQVERNSQPDCWATDPTDDRSRLVHNPETWCRIALDFTGAPARDGALLTLRRGVANRGLVELDRTSTLGPQVDAWGGTAAADGQDPVLVFDDGLGGFLPLSAATGLASDPLSLREAGIIPSPSTLTVLDGSQDVVTRTRRALYRHWLLSEGQQHPTRGLLARAARLTTELTLGRGDRGHLATLQDLSAQMAMQDLAAAWSLTSSLQHYRAQWESYLPPAVTSRPVGPSFLHAPCHSTCPANIDIPSFIAHLGNGDYRATVEVIRRDNPLPLVCGLVCPAPCESACVRGGSNGAVHIRPLKATAAQHCLAEGGYPRPVIAPATGKRIGIVGSGPASLTAAFYLRIYGHEVEIFESAPKAGGQLRYGIPAYRMPPDLLDQEIEQITVLGVPLHTDAPVTSLEDFRARYDAVFVGLGTQRARLIPVEGAHQDFVLGGLDFLHDVRGGKDVRVGPRVVVIGGGDVSIDVALTALRQGAQRVDLTSLERRSAMPASPSEIELAVGEGVRLHDGWGPVSIDPDGRMHYHACARTKDDQGRFAPVFDDGRLMTLEADHVIMATGQGTDLDLLEGSAVETNRGFIVADPVTKMTSVAGVFAGGDAQHGPRTAVEAIRSGKIAAAAIDAWLRGQPMDPSVGTPITRDRVLPLEVLAHDRTYLPRAVMPERSVEEVLGEGNYVQIEEGLTDAMAHDEARRCLRCDVCIGCGACMAVCSEMGVEALRLADTPAGRLAYFDFTRPASACIGCGACTQVCPTGAIHLDDHDGVRRTVVTGTVVQEQPLLTCSECGAPTQTPAHCEYIRARMPAHMAALLDRELCPQCARGRADRPHLPGGAVTRTGGVTTLPWPTTG